MNKKVAGFNRNYLKKYNMEYIVSLKSSVIVDAETSKEAARQIDDAIEDAGERNCGGIDDEILANTTVVKVKKEKSD